MNNLNRIFQIALLVLLICLCVLGVAALGTFLYVRYADAPSRIAGIERQTQWLESRPEWRIRRWTWRISTTDRPDSTNSSDYKLVFGTNAVQKFDDVLGKESGRIVTAWVSDWTPRSEMSKFDQFNVHKRRDKDTEFEISAKAQTNESVAMQFTVTFIIEE
jgi:hypothetical protein